MLCANDISTPEAVYLCARVFVSVLVRLCYKDHEAVYGLSPSASLAFLTDCLPYKALPLCSVPTGDPTEREFPS